ncbi:MAG: hypothetical protein KKD97_09570 [Gammaproteobacteria bacterium]|nr:hypothetical protein [Gammaproteobacteria bacterium]
MSLQHSDLDRRSLAIHRLAVEKLEREPALLSRARAILARWRAASSARTAPDLDEWQRLLDTDGGSGVLTVALEDTERAAQLRQSSPLACLLTSQERFAIIKQWRNSHAKA